jgi:cytochrome P450
LPTAANRRFAEAKRTLDDVVLKIIADRREDHRRAEARGEAGPAVDLLDMLMRATDETGTERMSDQQLRDEVMTLVLAGHETTANALSWLFVLLGRHPEAARRLLAEVETACPDRSPTFADLKQLPYTSRVVDEAMRLYPPVWIFERQALRDDELGGHRVEAGTIVGVCTWTLHRDPTLWDEPNVFDPDRFLPERSEGRDRYAYVPFGAGPRQCIGNAFAKMEAKLIVASIVQRFGVSLVHGQRIVPSAKVTLRPQYGVRARIRARV